MDLLRFYGLRTAPFAPTPDPRYLFLSAAHRQALVTAQAGLAGRKGFVLLVGEVGTGKTLLVRHLLARLGPGVRTACVLNAALTFDELLEAILRDLGVPCPGRRRLDMLRALDEVLLREAEAGRDVVVVVDEAQGLSTETLEQLRLLSNLETASSKLVQIVLVGQPELAEKLARPELRQLRQRITAAAALAPLGRRETAAYVAHRVAVAGGSAHRLFTGRALRRVHRESGGIPRVVNVICDRALARGHAGGSARVGAAAIRRAARPALPAWRGRRRGVRRLAAAAVAGLAAISVAAVLHRGSGLLAGAPALRAAASPPALRAAAPPPEAAGSSPGAAAGGRGAPHRDRAPAAGSGPEETGVSGSGPAIVGEDGAVPAGGVQVVAGPGDTLAGLAGRVYGRADLTVLDLLKRANPDLDDVDRIAVGARLRFPPLGPAARVVRSGTAYRVHLATRAGAPGADLAALQGTAQRAGSQVYAVPVRLGEHLRGYRLVAGDFATRGQALAFAASVREP